MMDDLIPKLLHVWLDSAVPISLREIDQFQAVIESAKQFCIVLQDNGVSGFNELKQWVSDAPSIWLSKCRETALDSVRTKLSGGIGESKQVERIEKQMVTRAERDELAAGGAAVAVADADDWGAAWADEEEDAVPRPDPELAAPKAPAEAAEEGDDGADAWGWGDEDGGAEGKPDDAPEGSKQENKENDEDDDDAGAAWGWGDEDTADEPQAESSIASKAAAAPAQVQTREMVLKETYNISSMPQPVLDLILSILEDGASLTQGGYDTLRARFQAIH